ERSAGSGYRFKLAWYRFSFYLICSCSSSSKCQSYDTNDFPDCKQTNKHLHSLKKRILLLSPTVTAY
ncbi:unnamed protein product, partial [Amoebophrya sp. A25]